jgi:hypothetical protein
LGKETPLQVPLVSLWGPVSPLVELLCVRMETYKPGPSPAYVDPDDPCPSVDDPYFIRGSPKDLSCRVRRKHIKFFAFYDLPVKLSYCLHCAILQKEMPLTGLDLSLLNRGHSFFVAGGYIVWVDGLGKTGIYQLS